MISSIIPSTQYQACGMLPFHLIVHVHPHFFCSYLAPDAVYDKLVMASGTVPDTTPTSAHVNPTL
jgi:hypothetical protein